MTNTLNAVIPSKFLSLNKKWKEVVFALSGFGPNLLMIIMGARFMSAFLPTALMAALPSVQNLWSVAFDGTHAVVIVFSALFIPLSIIAKAFDGLIDIPFANLTDSFKSKWGKRRPMIAICFIPMVLSYVLSWIPLYNGAGYAPGDFMPEYQQIWNTLWLTLWSLIFFASYTMSLIAFYGSLSTVCANEEQRTRVSTYKSIFDTIGYAIGYALFPVIAGFLVTDTIRINHVILFLVPLMLTMLIPIFIIKEGKAFEDKMARAGVKFVPLEEEKPVKLLESIKTTFRNKPYLKWILVNCCSFFGLQMFLLAMGELIPGLMGLNQPWHQTLLNTFAFAPVPLMLFLYRKVIRKKGIRFAYQTSMITFAISILSFVLGSQFVWGSGDDTVFIRMLIGIVGGVIGSWAIGSFFMVPYLIPSQIAAAEIKLTGKNNSSMYFAGQAAATSVVGAIAGYGVYQVIKGLYLDPNWQNMIMVQEGSLPNIGDIPLGVFLVPFIVSLFCLLGFAFAFLMPKRYNIETIAKALKLEHKVPQHERGYIQEDDVDSQGLVGNIMLWFLSVGLFEIFWRYNLMKKYYRPESRSKAEFWVIYLISLLIPVVIYGIITNKMVKSIGLALEEIDYSIIDDGKKGLKKLSDRRQKYKNILAFVFATIGLSVVSNTLLQSDLGKISKYRIAKRDLEIASDNANVTIITDASDIVVDSRTLTKEEKNYIKVYDHLNKLEQRYRDKNEGEKMHEIVWLRHRLNVEFHEKTGNHFDISLLK